MRASAPQVGPAAFDLNADSQADVAADWAPRSGETVRLLTVGGSNGQVLSGPDAKGKLTIKVCLHAGQMLLSLHGVLKPINIAPLNARNGQAIKRLMYLLKWARCHERSVESRHMDSSLHQPQRGSPQQGVPLLVSVGCDARRRGVACVAQVGKLVMQARLQDLEPLQQDRKKARQKSTPFSKRQVGGPFAGDSPTLCLCATQLKCMEPYMPGACPSAEEALAV